MDVLLSDSLSPDGPQLIVRKAPSTPPALADLVDDGTLPGAAAEFLQNSLLARRNILIAGKGRCQVLRYKWRVKFRRRRSFRRYHLRHCHRRV